MDPAAWLDERFDHFQVDSINLNQDNIAQCIALQLVFSSILFIEVY